MYPLSSVTVSKGDTPRQLVIVTEEKVLKLDAIDEEERDLWVECLTHFNATKEEKLDEVWRLHEILQNLLSSPSMAQVDLPSFFPSRDDAVECKVAHNSLLACPLQIFASNLDPLRPLFSM